MNPNQDGEINLPSKGMFPMKKGDLFHHITAGAAGWGDPLDRDLSSILDDVVNEKLTPDYVRKEYGVAVKSDPGKIHWEIDQAETAKLRSMLKSNSA